MPEANTYEWPKTPEGTTDWEVVFESREFGLIPLIEQARTCRALRESTLVIIKMLFTRPKDAEHRAEYEEMIDSYLPADLDSAANGNIESKRTKITAVLREIKEFRKRMSIANDMTG